MRNLAFFLLLSLGILSTAEIAVIVTTVQPAQASRQELWAFFASLGLMLASWGSLIWHAVKSRIIYRINQPSMAASVRQAALFAAVITLCLFFNSLGILSPWDVIPLAVAVMLIEFFFQAEKTAPSSAHHP